MAFISCKSPFYKFTLAFWLFVSLTLPLPEAPHVLPASTLHDSQAPRPATNSEGSQATFPTQSNEDAQRIPLSEKQKRDLMKSNYEKMKHEARDLTDLAKALQDELDKSNENILSLDVVDKADKIEKLARKIKGTARGF